GMEAAPADGGAVGVGGAHPAVAVADDLGRTHTEAHRGAAVAGRQVELGQRGLRGVEDRDRLVCDDQSVDRVEAGDPVLFGQVRYADHQRALIAAHTYAAVARRRGGDTVAP